jgi:hypothetical protein
MRPKFSPPPTRLRSQDWGLPSTETELGFARLRGWGKRRTKPVFVLYRTAMGSAMPENQRG